MAKHDLARDILQRQMLAHDRNLQLWRNYQRAEPTHLAAEKIAYLTGVVEQLRVSIAALRDDEPTPPEQLATVIRLTDHRKKDHGPEDTP